MKANKKYNDLKKHIDALNDANLLVVVDRQIDKDSEMHPLVRWQFIGGIEENQRKAFLFTNVVDGKGRKFDIPVLVGGLAANRHIYSVGMSCPLQEIQKKWDNAISNPIKPKFIDHAPCHQIIEEGET